MKLKFIFLSVLILLTFIASAQLKPGFNPNEYLELLSINRQHADTSYKGDKTPRPHNFHRIYRSPVGPLQNRWDLWTNDSIAVISIRGTTGAQISWMENFYSAMVPATGSLHLDDSTTFNYHLADNPRAAVHVGWLMGMAYLSKTIVPQIESLYQQKHIKSIIIIGHSQGGAIAYLLRSYLADLQKSHTIPADIIFKTYCSAPPKPGNTYYAYEYEHLTRDGWGLAVINAADWVPETPVSVQTITDFNTLNPFTNADKALSKQKFFVKLYLKHVYNQLKNPGIKARNNNQKYLGHTLYKYLKKTLPQFAEPTYAESDNYVRCGTPVVLLPDNDYRNNFKDDPKNVFMHHLFYAYYYLTQRNYQQNK